MRHLFVTAALILVGMAVTFGTASFLQGVQTANRAPVYLPEPAVAERSKAPVVKQRTGELGRQVVLAAARRTD
ncbi:MAG: hypothetical protein ACHQK9_24285 [Reyranellales bacterium]